MIAITARVEGVSRRRGAAVAVGLAAAAVVLVPGTAIPQPSILPWARLAFCVPLVYGTYHNYVAYDWPDGLDSWQAGVGEILAAALAILPIYLLADNSAVVFGLWARG